MPILLLRESCILMWIFRDRLRPHQQRSKVFEFIVQPRTAGAPTIVHRDGDFGQSCTSAASPSKLNDDELNVV